MTNVGTDDWKQIDTELRRLARAEASLDHEIGRWLLAAQRAEVHRNLGHATAFDYVEHVFGYGPRMITERLRVARALEALPQMSSALERGERAWSAVRELSRVVTPQTERAWLDATQGRTVRDIERLVSGHLPGALPSDPPDPELRKYVVRLELDGEQKATYREAIAAIRSEVDPSLTEEEALTELCRRARGGDRDEGRSSYQVALTVCERCERTWQDGDGERYEVSPEVAERASCDAQEIGSLTHVGQRATQTVPPWQVTRRDGGVCRVPGCRCRRFVDLHHIRLRSEGDAGAATIRS